MAFKFVATVVKIFYELDTCDASSNFLECIMQVEVVDTWFSDSCVWWYRELLSQVKATNATTKWVTFWLTNSSLKPRLFMPNFFSALLCVLLHQLKKFYSCSHPQHGILKSLRVFVWDIRCSKTLLPYFSLSLCWHPGCCFSLRKPNAHTTRTMESREWNHGLTETQAQAGLSFFTFLISGKKGKTEIDCVLSNVDRLLVGSKNWILRLWFNWTSSPK